MGVAKTFVVTESHSVTILAFPHFLSLRKASALTLLPHSIEISRWAKENHRKRVALQALGVAVSHLDGGIPPGKLQKGRDGMMMMVMVVVMLMVLLIMAKIILM